MLRYRFSPTFIYGFSVIQIKIPAILFVDSNKIPKFKWKGKKLESPKQFWKKSTKLEDTLQVSWLTNQENMWYWLKDEHNNWKTIMSRINLTLIQSTDIWQKWKSTSKKKKKSSFQQMVLLKLKQEPQHIPRLLFKIWHMVVTVVVINLSNHYVVYLKQM